MTTPAYYQSTPPQPSQPVQPPPPQAQDADTLEKELEKNPDDFNKWELYVAKREQEQNADRIRVAYEKLLQEYPLLFGYWKKYADFEANIKSGVQVVINVYERGVNAVPQSVELWTHYCVYVAEVSQDLNGIRGYGFVCCVSLCAYPLIFHFKR